MIEIKKILPTSLAKYSSLIVAIATLFLAIIRFIYYVIQNQIPMNIIGQGIGSVLIDILMQTILSYVAFWIIGYLFAKLFNLFAKKSRGLIVDFQEIDLALLKQKKAKHSKENREQEKDEEIEVDKKFVV